MDTKTKITSSPFIKTFTDSLTSVDIPVIDENKNIPVISCIGTARDGKSSLLDFYCQWIMDKFNLEPKPRYPFIAKESADNSTMTNGIDYYQVHDECMLIDCQGMQLSNAKFDHHLALIIYLISNVIILTVRQRLDLQVLNNLLSMFSFLPQIEEQFRRKDKPKLIIRIKDSPYEKQLKKNNMFLNTMVINWLEKTGDQYDVIKQVFMDTFEIHVIATSYPVLNKDQDVKNSTEYDLDDDRQMDIYDKNFSTLNPSFVTACETIYALSNGTTTSRLMKDSKLLEDLIQKLKTNTNIDFKKLDLYHNIIANELLEYSRNCILQEPYIDQSIVDRMDGSSSACSTYRKRLQMIKELRHQTMNIKFKDVPEEMKLQKLDSDFIRIKSYADTARIKNIRIAEEYVLPHWTCFRKKFDGTNAEKMVQGFIEIFVDREKEFVKKLEKIDDNVRSKYIDLLEKEKSDLELKQRYIISCNEKQMDLVNARISECQIDRQVESQILNHIKSINAVNMQYNHSTMILESSIRKNIVTKLEYIYKDLNYVRYLGSDHHVYKRIQSATTKDINEMIDRYSMLLDKLGFEIYYIKELHNRLVEIGFLKNVNYACIPDIQFIELIVGDTKYCMVEQFFAEKFQIVLKQITDKYPYIDIEQKENVENVRKFIMVVKVEIMNPSMDLNKKTLINEMLQYNIINKILIFCLNNSLQFV